MTSSARPSIAGLLDTNVIIHAYTSDQHSDECRRFLRGLERGELEARLEPPILHELSYSMPRYLKQLSRRDVADYLLMVLGWPGIRGDKVLMSDTVLRWRDTAGLAFIDAFLAALAQREGCPVFTKNVNELVSQGVAVPQPLPGGVST